MDRLKKNFRTFLLPGLLVCIGFWGVAPFVDVRHVYAFVNAMALMVAVVIVIAYSPEVWETVRLPRKEVSGGHLLVLGIVVAWISSAERGAFSYVYRYLGEPKWMMDTLLQAFAVWVLVWGGVMHVTAKGAIHGHIPRRNWVKLGWAVAGAVALVLFGLWFLDPLNHTAAEEMPGLTRSLTRSLTMPAHDSRLADTALPAW